MCCKTPKVSIGIPVYNCEILVGQAIQSVLDQTFTDFELIISDNASTDRTSEICRGYAAKDPRIRYYRNEKNLGVAKNVSCVFEPSTGEYFKWLAADDAMEPQFLKRCVELLDNEPEVILAFSRVKGYDVVTNEIRFYDDDLNLTDPRPYQRYVQALLRARGHCRPIWGLIRRRVLTRTHLIRPFIGADDCLVIELALIGRFAQLPERLYRMNFHLGSYCGIKRHNDYREGVAETRFYDPQSTGKVYLPYWKRLWEYGLLAVHAKEHLGGKLIMLGFLLYYFATRWYRRLGSELIFAVGLGAYYVGLKKTIKMHFLRIK